MSGLEPIVFLKICAVALAPIMVGIIWLLPSFLDSKRLVKVTVGAVVVALFTVTTLIIVDNSGLHIQSVKIVAAIGAVVWGILGFFVGMYFDVRQRVKLGPQYYQEMLRLRNHAVEYGIIGAIISLLPGVVTGWIITTFGDSILGIFLSIVFGASFGGVLGGLLDKLSARS